jgi:hypothetical protein
MNESGQWIPPTHEEINYIDYFHSLLHVSPNGEYFLSNGWIWHPEGQILCFRTDDFLERYEPSNVPIDYSNSYNWDRPCAFIGDNRFVIATDVLKHQPYDASLENYRYRQLLFYRPDTPVGVNQYGERTLVREREVPCGAFRPDKEGHVRGELAWDAKYGFLAAVTPDGAFAISVDGEVLESLPECKCQKGRPSGSRNNLYSGWRYNPERHLLYNWSQEANAIEERRFLCCDGLDGLPPP